MTAVPAQVVGGGGTISFRINTKAVAVVVEGMPKAAYFWLRDFFGRSLVQHRVKWLASKSTRFGRGGIKVSRVNEGTGALDKNEVRYTVEPDERKMLTTPQAVAGLQKLRAEIGTGNTVLPVHEFGTDIRSAREMFVPTLKGNQHQPADISKWRAKNPSAQLLFLPSKRDGKTMVYEVKLKRRRGRVSADFMGPAPMDQKLKLRWVTTKFVEMNPTLRLYDSWDDLRTERDAMFRTAADRMIRDLVRGDRRDL